MNVDRHLNINILAIRKNNLINILVYEHLNIPLYEYVDFFFCRCLSSSFHLGPFLST